MSVMQAPRLEERSMTVPQMSRPKELPYPDSLYEADEHEWIAVQVAALRDGTLDRLDRAHLAEYLTDMTVRDRRELTSRLIVLLTHLLKIREQPERLTRSWVNTVRTQQREINLMLQGIPSLGRQADQFLAGAYPDAVKEAAGETGLPKARFPAASPWTVDEALTFDPPAPPPSPWHWRGRRSGS
jgi:hypothetical protein